MEIKTCEEYVLAELKRLEDENRRLEDWNREVAAKNKALREEIQTMCDESHAEMCKNVSPNLDDNMNNGVAQFKCSVCGCALYSWDDDRFGVILDMGSNFIAVSYCPNCGRKVMTE